MSYGDFDINQTYKIMVSSEKFNVKELVSEYLVLRGLDSTSGLPNNMISDTTIDFVNYLENMGFSDLKRKSVCFSD